jgi:hypothetical protein
VGWGARGGWVGVKLAFARARAFFFSGAKGARGRTHYTFSATTWYGAPSKSATKRPGSAPSGGA